MATNNNNGSKSWVRQWLALMFGGALIACAVIQMVLSVSIPIWFLIIAGGGVTWFFGSREIEKWK